MIILVFILAVAVGSAMSNLDCLPNMWEWWAVVGYGFISVLTGFDLGVRANKKKEEKK